MLFSVYCSNFSVSVAEVSLGLFNRACPATEALQFRAVIIHKQPLPEFEKTYRQGPMPRCLVPHMECKLICFATQLYRVYNQQNFMYFYFYLIPGQIEETDNTISQNRMQTLSFWLSPLVYNACLVCKKANN